MFRLSIVMMVLVLSSVLYSFESPWDLPADTAWNGVVVRAAGVQPRPPTEAVMDLQGRFNEPITLDQETFWVWVNIEGVRAQDTSSFVIYTPDGRPYSGGAFMHRRDYDESYWYIGVPLPREAAQAGEWRWSYLLEGIPRAEGRFRVQPSASRSAT